MIGLINTLYERVFFGDEFFTPSNIIPTFMYLAFFVIGIESFITAGKKRWLRCVVAVLVMIIPFVIGKIYPLFNDCRITYLTPFTRFQFGQESLRPTYITLNIRSDLCCLEYPGIFAVGAKRRGLTSTKDTLALSYMLGLSTRTRDFHSLDCPITGRICKKGRPLSRPSFRVVYLPLNSGFFLPRKAEIPSSLSSVANTTPNKSAS